MTSLLTLWLTYLALNGANADKGGVFGFADGIAKTLEKGANVVKTPVNSGSNFAKDVGKGVSTSFEQGVQDLSKTPASSGSNIAKQLGKSIGQEIAAIKHPIEETLVYIGSSQCSHVKKIVGVAYEQIDGAKEPDLDQLAFEYRDNLVRVIYNINAAANIIPEVLKNSTNDKLIVFIHGFTDDPTQSGFKNISESFLNRGECNVLALDSSSLIKWFYLRSTTYVRFIGEKLGQTLAAVYRGGVSPLNIHIIGHSLGSHISGFAGKTFHQLTGRRIGRISALDPAGPCFSHIDPELRLKDSDAEFVDVTHTDGGVYGLWDAIGHADFYPNSGSEQPGCFAQTCSHSRAWLLYAESVLNPDAFPAVRCEDWNAFKKGQCENVKSNMGYACPPDTRGRFYLQTAEESPYGLGQKGLRYENKEPIVKNIVDTVKSG